MYLATLMFGFITENLRNFNIFLTKSTILKNANREYF